MLKSFRMFESQEDWDAQTADTQEKLKQNSGFSDLAAFGAKLLFDRITERPEAYAEFGVYWFAVKDVMARHGYHFGDTMDEEMLAEYRGKTDVHTLIAAEKFKEFYRENYFENTTHFTLEQDGREWVLNDPEMAARV
ncbi:hypothetical protein LVJ83_09690 [Uruburuella testudinis]|uniref:DUF4375 domain-containing protein n=1 Tax=Uruburuella testudinis TaxID=1282863 RepID=A0ABY4DUE3_9NEIS|nr:hypothetical protein [Uruburuella testudinis]UOO81237.1 hypothetical protein LVJ83_09690 [Uruburuella testudinis]